MSIKLAMELPTSRLATWSPLADLDFILAHQVLEDQSYAEYFRVRPAARELILDNSYHELGVPLAARDLLEAARRCRANYVIAPDKVGDVEFNTEMFFAARKLLYPTYGVAVVMTGDPAETDWEEFLNDVRDADMLCCTFKSPVRYERFVESDLAWTWNRIHLLGVGERNELAAWTRLSKNHPDIEFSVDTGKALKWAMELKTLDAMTSWRGAPLASKDLLNLRADQICDPQEAIFFHNIEVLKSVLE